MAVFARVDIDPPGLSKGHEGAEAQQVDYSDESKHGRPWACGLNKIPREIHHEDPCGGRQSHREAFHPQDPVSAIKYLFPQKHERVRNCHPFLTDCHAPMMQNAKQIWSLNAWQEVHALSSVNLKNWIADLQNSWGCNYTDECLTWECSTRVHDTCQVKHVKHM